VPIEVQERIIPPLSFVKVTSESASWHEEKGRSFRIGYYNRNDGLDCVWLVDDNGQYEQTADQAMIREHFTILKLSDETDLFGDDRDAIGPRDMV
jgi:hypothetical protein